MKSTPKKAPVAPKPPAGKIVVPPRAKLGDLTNAELVRLRDSLHGRTDIEKSYKRAVRVHERATRAGKKVAKKPAAKKSTKEALPRAA